MAKPQRLVKGPVVTASIVIIRGTRGSEVRAEFALQRAIAGRQRRAKVTVV